MAVTGTFANATVNLTGDDLDNAITVSRNAAGTILANGGAIAIQGGTPTVANTNVIAISGLGGNDTITLDEASGALPTASLLGGDGNDVITSGSGVDTLRGGQGNDTLLGKGGGDVLHGDEGNDTLTGGDADDQMFGEAGDDRMIWNPGDDSDLMEGGDGNDTAEVNGGNGAEIFTLTANGTRVRFDRVDPAPFTLDVGTTENIVVNMNGGNDSFSATGNLAALIKVTVDGGTGNDTILGSNGDDVLRGGADNDFIDGNGGADIAQLGDGDDTFLWDPGDGSDTVDGGAGTDTLVFNGSAANEQFAIVANGDRARLTRDIGNIVMDLDNIETIQLNAFGGADNVVVNDLSGTDVREVNISLLLGATTDGQPDKVTVRGTNGNDAQINVVADIQSVDVLGLAARVNVFGPEGANDSLVVEGLGGNDTITATGNLASFVKLTLDGGDGSDVILGGNGADILLGGNGNDFVDGNQGNDTAFLGEGDDVFQWDPGDGSDTVEGQGGTDTLLFNGANINEIIDISANGDRARFTRNVANIVMDLNDVETIKFNAFGGEDLVTVNDLAPTDVKTVDINLAATIGGTTADGFADTVVINGSGGNDTISLSLQNGKLVVDGLASQVVIENFDANDTIRINGLAGDDVIDASGLGVLAAKLNVIGGDGNDILIGSAGVDTLDGGAGNDVLIGNAGADVLDGGPGENILIQDDQPAPTGGPDVVFGSANADIITVSRNAAGAILSNGAAIPGALAAANASVVQVFGKDSNDVLALDETNGPLPRAEMFGGAGNDTLTGGSAGDHLFGEAGNDALFGKGGQDFLFGGDGDDTLTGGTGDDLMFGEAGNDRMIWNPGEGTDLMEGGSGNNDTAEVNGAGGDETFNVIANGTRVRFDRVNPAPFSLDIGTTENLVVNMGGGNDSFSATGNLAALIKVTVDGGDGNDTILGGNGADLLLGGAGNDFIDGNQGNDAALLGDGDDVFQWDPGDGSDTVEGQAGFDTLLFNGANIAENIEVSANGDRARFTRDIANITMDLNDVEQVTFKGLGGNDKIVVKDLSGTDVKVVSIDGGTGDDNVDGSAQLAADVSLVVLGGTGADKMAGGAGSDTLSYADSALGVNVDLATNTASGGDAQGDVIASFENVIGSSKADTLIGNAADNTFTGGADNDVMIGGSGEDTAVFNVDFNTVKVTFEGKNIVIESAEGHDVLNGFENFQFTDGTIHLNDGNPLVNDLFYFARNKDVWDAGVDAEAHYNAFGFTEGRDPNPEFSTNGYLSANADVRAAGFNPLSHFEQFGFREGRDPSASFDLEQYLLRNPDVAEAGFNPLSHFEQFGRDEGRSAFGAVGTVQSGFDAEFYLLSNPDVGFAGINPFDHYHAFGFHEGRNPNAFFDTNGYLAAYQDVAVAGVDPLQHYLAFGAKEGRDPSGAFDTKAYLAANPDVAAAGVNPLAHFLEFGIHEGRLPLGDGVFA
jgi:Ca2+-binding RTX toxin-like protein